jgi:hypothetical protein
MRDAAMADGRGRKAEEVLLLALACGATVEGAARQAGLSERSAYRRLADKNFRRRLREMRDDMVQRTVGGADGDQRGGGAGSAGTVEVVVAGRRAAWGGPRRA